MADAKPREWDYWPEPEGEPFTSREGNERAKNPTRMWQIEIAPDTPESEQQ